LPILGQTIRNTKRTNRYRLITFIERAENRSRGALWLLRGVYGDSYRPTVGRNWHDHKENKNLISGSVTHI